MKNELQATRLLHWALITTSIALIAVVLLSTHNPTYESARHWLAELSAIDLDKWAKRVEIRQHAVLNGLSVIDRALEAEAEQARVPIKKGLVVQERLTIRLHPSASDVHNATMETLLMGVFRNVKAPELLYPDEQSLRMRLRELFSKRAVEGVGNLVLSSAVLSFDTVRDAPSPVVLRLEWEASEADINGAIRTVTHDVSLDGTHQPEIYDFAQYIRDMNPGLLKAGAEYGVAGEEPDWPSRVREQLSPVWGEISDKNLATAYAHVQTRFDETKDDFALFGLGFYRQQILVPGSIALLLVVSALLFYLTRVNNMAPKGSLVSPNDPFYSRFPRRLALVLTFLSVVALPVLAFVSILVRFGEARLSVETVAAALVASAGAICAIQAYRSVLELQRPKLSEADQQRIELVKASIASYKRAAHPYRIPGRLMLILGVIVGPIGAMIFSLYLIGLGIGADPHWSGPLSLLAILLSPLLMLVGWVLAAGRKELVLFLRRFGNESLNDSVRDLVQTVLRRRARLVTLDDSAFVRLGPRWRGLAVSLLPSGLVLGAIALWYSGFAKVAESELREETPFGTALMFILLGINLLGIAACLAAVLLFLAALRAHFLSHRVVHDASSLAQALRKLRGLRSFARAPVIAAPMATVVSVTDSEWQATVASIARICDIALIDISHAREHIRWEIATLKEARTRIVLLAQREALARWWNTTADDIDGELAAQLRHLAAGLPLVTYDAPDRLNETRLLEILSNRTQPA